ncbi:MAG: hypothetical protein L0H70_00205 [Xanthomonadales bacterium]|nr:hypothetical protein [Xanthomonadales bacterium]
MGIQYRCKAFAARLSLQGFRCKAFAASLLIMLACSPAMVRAQGFPDQGFDNGLPAISTDYYASTEGTSVNPLTFSSCIFPTGECDTGPMVFQQSNVWRQSMPAWACFGWMGPCNHWTLILNNEAAYNTENSGPPDASLPRSLPGYGIFGFATLFGNANFPGDTLWRAHMVLNLSSQFPNPDTNQKTPYMAIGAWDGWGSPPGETIGVLNPSTSAGLTTVEFGEREWQFIPTQHWAAGPTQPLVVYAYMTVFADWGTSPKAIQVNLFHWTNPNFDWPGWLPLKWNWPIVESVYHPGAQFAGVEAENIQSLCGFAVPRLQFPGQDVNYSIDLNALFHCANQAGMFDEPLPQTADIPITSVSWATEGTGKDGGIWVDVHSMRMVSSSQALLSPLPQNQLIETADEYGSDTAKIQQRLKLLCNAEPGCTQRAERSMQRDPAVYNQPKATAQQWQMFQKTFGWRVGKLAENANTGH